MAKAQKQRLQALKSKLKEKEREETPEQVGAKQFHHEERKRQGQAGLAGGKRNRIQLSDKEKAKKRSQKKPARFVEASHSDSSLHRIILAVLKDHFQE